MKNFIILAAIALWGLLVFGLYQCNVSKDNNSVKMPDSVYVGPKLPIDSVRGVKRDTFKIKVSIDRFLISEPSDTLTFEGKEQKIKVYKDLEKNYIFIEVR